MKKLEITEDGKGNDPKILDIASIIKKKSDDEYMAKIEKMIDHLKRPPE